MSASLTAVVVAISLAFAFREPGDAYQWLEDVDGPAALAWAGRHTERTLQELRSDPDFFKLRAQASAIMANTLAYPTRRGELVFNLWQDERNTKGVLRRAALASYPDPAAWETAIDFDALSSAEGKSWTFRGLICLPPAEQRCLLSLSQGGRDAIEVREFDLASNAFVPNGFRLTPDRQHVAWLDADTILVTRNWDRGAASRSTIPYIVKRWRRGTPLSAAVEVFRGGPNDALVAPIVLQGGGGRPRATLFIRQLSGFAREFWLAWGDRSVRVRLPRRASARGSFAGQLIFSLEESLTVNKVKFPEGSLISLDPEQVKRDGLIMPSLIIAPTANEAIEQVAFTQRRMLVSIYDNLIGRLLAFERVGGAWISNPMQLPAPGSVEVTGSSARDDRIFVTTSGYASPDALYVGDAKTGRFTQLLAAPPVGEPDIVVERHEASARDGVCVPYFVMHRAGMSPDASNPTLLVAYGGFGVSLRPSYSAIQRQLWVRRGGVYVVANIRGGGEFGSKWHDAGVALRRNIVFNDFLAVAEDLIARKITSPRRLGILGASNGGLLMGVAMTKRPDLWNAVVMQVPVLDMLRFHKLFVGSAWTAEYGDPEKPVERAFLQRFSPYHNLKTRVRYPEPFFITSRADDRVHPAHARKMAAKMEALGLPFYFLEAEEGGHAAGVDLSEKISRVSLEFTYLSRKLMDCQISNCGAVVAIGAQAVDIGAPSR